MAAPAESRAQRATLDAAAEPRSCAFLRLFEVGRSRSDLPSTGTPMCTLLDGFRKAVGSPVPYLLLCPLLAGLRRLLQRLLHQRLLCGGQPLHIGVWGPFFHTRGAKQEGVRDL